MENNLSQNIRLLANRKETEVEILSNKLSKLIVKTKVSHISEMGDMGKLLNIYTNAFSFDVLPNNFFQKFDKQIFVSDSVDIHPDDEDIHRSVVLLVPTESIQKYEDMYGIITDHRIKEMEEFRRTLTWQDDFIRMILQDGRELFQYAGVDFLTVHSQFCKLCQKHCKINGYTMAPQLASLIGQSGLTVMKISYPCQYQTLQEILVGRNCDPPHLEIVFPKRKIE